MKKSILTVVLLVMSIVPVFASEKNDVEIEVKAGYTLDNNVKLYLSEGTDSGSTDKNFIFGLDFYYYVNSQVALGLGANYILDSQADYNWEDKYGFTNVYFTVKPKMDLDSDILESFYFIAQVGYGFFKFDYDKSRTMTNPETENGLYWGLGVGLEIISNFTLELIHSFNYGSVKNNNETSDMRYSALSLNVGYRFSL